MCIVLNLKAKYLNHVLVLGERADISYISIKVIPKVEFWHLTERHVFSIKQVWVQRVLTN